MSASTSKTLISYSIFEVSKQGHLVVPKDIYDERIFDLGYRSQEEAIAAIDALGSWGEFVILTRVGRYYVYSDEE